MKCYMNTLLQSFDMIPMDHRDRMESLVMKMTVLNDSAKFSAKSIKEHCIKIQLYA